MNARLFTIEARRNVAIWLVPVLLVMCWLLLIRNAFRLDVVLWVETSARIGQVAIVAGPFIGGAAAWMAGREQRRGMEELIGTTPQSPVSRDLTLWLATAAWGIIAYGLVTVWVVALTARRATWDGPYWWPIVIGLIAVVANASVGYAIGRYLPSRFTAPLVAIGLFGAQVYVGWFVGEEGTFPRPPGHSAFEPAQFLSPLAEGSRSVWWGIWPDVERYQAVWLIGVTAVGLAAVILRSRRTAVTWAMLAASLLVATAGATETIRNVPTGYRALPIQQVRGEMEGEHRVPLRAYEPVCTGGSLVICVHPAFEAVLDNLSEQVHLLGGPVIGLPSAPTKAEQIGPVWQQSDTGEIVVFGLSEIFVDGMTNEVSAAVEQIVRCIVHNCADQGEQAPIPDSGYFAQEAIYFWLAQRPGVETPPYVRQWRDSDHGDPGMAAIVAAADRFAALDPAEQESWLEANYAALRAGKLTLEDLP